MDKKNNAKQEKKANQPKQSKKTAKTSSNSQTKQANTKKQKTEKSTVIITNTSPKESEKGSKGLEEHLISFKTEKKQLKVTVMK